MAMCFRCQDTADINHVLNYSIPMQVCKQPLCGEFFLQDQNSEFKQKRNGLELLSNITLCLHGPACYGLVWVWNKSCTTHVFMITETNVDILGLVVIAPEHYAGQLIHLTPVNLATLQSSCLFYYKLN